MSSQSRWSGSLAVDRGDNGGDDGGVGRKESREVMATMVTQELRQVLVQEVRNNNSEEIVSNDSRRQPWKLSKVEVESKGQELEEAAMMASFEHSGQKPCLRLQCPTVEWTDTSASLTHSLDSNRNSWTSMLEGGDHSNDDLHVADDPIPWVTRDEAVQMCNAPLRYPMFFPPWCFCSREDERRPPGCLLARCSCACFQGEPVQSASPLLFLLPSLQHFTAFPSPARFSLD